MAEEYLLEIRDLTVIYTSRGIELPVLRDINLCLRQGQVYGLVGESGSGKSTLGLSIMQYLPPEGHISKGKILLSSRNLLLSKKTDLQGLWGKEIAFVPQDPYTSLNPSMKIGKQISEIFRGHSNMSEKEAKERSIYWLKRVRLPNPELLATKYPHELSGGQKQRILTAMAFSNYPRLLVLDEPTTNLDVTTEVVVLKLLQELIEKENTSTLFITHNFGIVHKLTDRVAVLYAGELVEDAPTKNLIRKPIHPYTQGLIMSIPKVGMHKDSETLVDISGQVPSLEELPKGCVFSPRCQLAIELCHKERPPLESYSEDSRIRCFRWREIMAGEIKINAPEQPIPHQLQNGIQPMFHVENLEVTYPIFSPGLHGFLGQKPNFKVVNGINFQVGEGRTLGIVGESGSGKTSLALAIMGLIESTTGEINLQEMKLPTHLSKRNKLMFRKLQMVFQNIGESFPPYITVNEILIRPFLNLAGMSRIEAQKHVNALLERVHLPEEYIHKYSQHLSGGERQRLALAQVISINPSLIIADEPISSLDVSVQASILNLLNEIKRKFYSSYLFISHNIAVVSYMADDVLFIYLGQVMQYGKTKRVLSPPYHPYTEALLSSLPEINTEEIFPMTFLERDLPNPLESTKGCPFHSRCPRMLGKKCEDEIPPMQDTPDGGKIFCHIPISRLKMIQKDLLPIIEKGNG